MLEVGNFRRRTIAREDNLFVAIEEGVESVEEFLLRTLLPPEKMNVVDQEEIRLAIAFAELDQIVVLDRINELVDENLARKVHYAGVFAAGDDVLADGLHQVSLAEANPA